MRKASWALVAACLAVACGGGTSSEPPADAVEAVDAQDAGDVADVAEIPPEGGGPILLPDPSFWKDGDPCGPLPAECSNAGHCGPDEVCYAAQCIGPVAPDSYKFAPAISHFSRIQLPSEVGDEDCCFDLDGDGDRDNRLAELVRMAVEATQRNIDVTRTIQQAINSGELSLLVEARVVSDGCGPMQLWLWPGWNDLDYDGRPDASPHAIATGKATFRVDRSALDAHGAPIQWNRAAVDGTTFRAEGVSGVNGFLSFSLPGSGEPLMLESRQARYEGEVQVKDGSLWTIEEGGGALGGLRMGGFAPLSGIIDQLDAYARRCACAGIDPLAPVIVSGIAGGEWSTGCVQAPVDQNACNELGDGWVCANIETLCTAIPIFATVADISSGAKGTDGTTALDSLSFGLRMSLVGATLGDPPFTLPRFATDDTIEVWDLAETVRLDVTRNDRDAGKERATVASVTQPAHGSVEVVEDGAAVMLHTDPAYRGLDTFTYAIAGETSKGTAKVRVLLKTLVPQGADDEVTADLNRGPIEIDVMKNDRWDPTVDAFVRLGGPANISESGTYGWRTLDRKRLVVLPKPSVFDERTITMSYTIGEGAGPATGMAKVTLHLVRPATECGDGFVDPWAGEECDDRNVKAGDGCDGNCKLEACAGGGMPAPCYRDADGDGYGDPADVVYACECPSGRVPAGGDCRDDLFDVHPGQSEAGPAACTDGLDNDCAYGADCGNFTCDDLPECTEWGNAYCANGIDDDGDGATDCADPECHGTTTCKESDCGNGIDDDGDNWPDCFDWTCNGRAPCNEESCDDGKDDDGDGDTDCDDTDCKWKPVCAV